MDTAPILYPGYVNEHSVSTLDLSLWTPEIQSGAGPLGVCGCMTLSAGRARQFGAYLPIVAHCGAYKPQCIVCFPRRDSYNSDTATGGMRVRRGVAVLLSSPPDARSAPVGLEDKRTKWVNPMSDAIDLLLVRVCVWHHRWPVSSPFYTLPPSFYGQSSR